MSAMDDIHISPPYNEGSRPEFGHHQFSGLRDLLLAICLTILAALAMQATAQTGTAIPDGAAVVQDWKGNSGTLPSVH